MQSTQQSRPEQCSLSPMYEIYAYCCCSVASCHELQLVSDVTHKASLAAINKLGISVIMLGCKAAPWTFTLIPHQSEYEKYTLPTAGYFFPHRPGTGEYIFPTGGILFPTGGYTSPHTLYTFPGFPCIFS